MTLVDTSAWIDHLRHGDPELIALLERNQVLMHPMVIGELACGSLANRTALLAHLGRLPAAKVASHEEVMTLVEARQLHARGVGWVDAHLLASAILSAAPLLTRDKRLAQRCLDHAP